MTRAKIDVIPSGFLGGFHPRTLAGPHVTATTAAKTSPFQGSSRGANACFHHNCDKSIGSSCGNSSDRYWLAIATLWFATAQPQGQDGLLSHEFITGEQPGLLLARTSSSQ
jgi:hypothetical protein